jgi:DNA-directed RNA polymerase I, II, and III subunit RPABC2
VSKRRAKGIKRERRKTKKEGKREKKKKGKKKRGEERILIGPPKLTRFEKARIVGARALQLSMGAPLLIKPPRGVTNPVDLAVMELKKGVLPITIKRTLPDESYQDIPIQWLSTE